MRAEFSDASEALDYRKAQEYVTTPITDAKPEHRWWHAAHIHHHLVCLDCGLGWHNIKDMGAIAHTCGMEVTGGYATNHTSHYDKCCEIDNRCNRLRNVWCDGQFGDNRCDRDWQHKAHWYTERNR